MNYCLVFLLDDAAPINCSKLAGCFDKLVVQVGRPLLQLCAFVTCAAADRTYSPRRCLGVQAKG